jgi:tetratricopeptide (TPR) repeat protein
MMRYTTFCAFSFCTTLFCVPLAFAQGVAAPSKITPIRGGFFAEWSSPVNIAAVQPGKGLSGPFEVMFEVPNAEFINRYVDAPRSTVSDPVMVTTRTDYWIVRGTPDRAIPLYEHALNQGNLDEKRAVMFQNNLAMLYSQVIKDHAKAMAVVDEALALPANKDNYFLLDTKGLVHLNSGDPNAAVTPLERAVELSCQNPIYCMHLSTAYHQTGQLGPARKNFDQARAQLVPAAPKMAKENKKMFDDLQLALPPVGM